jgi:hypothetical protein
MLFLPPIMIAAIDEGIYVIPFWCSINSLGLSSAVGNDLMRESMGGGEGNINKGKKWI